MKKNLVKMAEEIEKELNRLEKMLDELLRKNK